MAARDRPTLLHVFPGFTLGGAQARVIRLIEAFGDRFRHHVCAMDGQYPAMSRIEALGRAVDVTAVEATFQKGRGAFNRDRIRDLLASLRPDAVFTHNWGTFEWVLANRDRAIRHYHVEEGFGPEETDRRLWRRSLARAVGFRIRHARLVVVSRTMERIARREWHVPAGRLQCIPNGVAVAAFPDLSEAQPGVAPSPSRPFVFGTVAGLRPEKRIDRLIAAAALLPADLPFELRIAGEGSERAALERQARESGLATRLRFLGHVHSPVEVYRGLDCFVLPSDTEQMSLSLLEAMACGLPVVATEVGDNRTIVAPVDPCQVVPTQAEAISCALRALAIDPDRRTRLGRSNRGHVARTYPLSRMVSSWERLYAGEARASITDTAPSPGGRSVSS